MNNNYYRILANAKTYLDKVSVTGTEESNKLAECGMFIDMLLRGEIEFAQPQQSAQPPQE